MPTYKNRRSMPQGTKVWHYTSLEAVIAMLRDRQMRLTRIDKFCDPFEGSVPKKTIDDQVVIFGGAQARENAEKHRYFIPVCTSLGVGTVGHE